MIVAIVFDPDPEMAEPTDPRGKPLVRGVFVPPGSDVVVMWREFDPDFDDGYRWRTAVGGIWENVPDENIEAALGALLADDDLVPTRPEEPPEQEP